MVARIGPARRRRAPVKLRFTRLSGRDARHAEGVVIEDAGGATIDLGVARVELNRRSLRAVETGRDLVDEAGLGTKIHEDIGEGGVVEVEGDGHVLKALGRRRRRGAPAEARVEPDLAVGELAEGVNHVPEGAGGVDRELIGPERWSGQGFGWIGEKAYDSESGEGEEEQKG